MRESLTVWLYPRDLQGYGLVTSRQLSRVIKLHSVSACAPLLPSPAPQSPPVSASLQPATRLARSRLLPSSGRPGVLHVLPVPVGLLVLPLEGNLGLVLSLRGPTVSLTSLPHLYTPLSPKPLHASTPPSLVPVPGPAPLSWSRPPSFPFHVRDCPSHSCTCPSLGESALYSSRGILALALVSPGIPANP